MQPEFEGGTNVELDFEEEYRLEEPSSTPPGAEERGEPDPADGALNTLDWYMREARRFSRLSLEEEQQLGKRALAGDPDAVRRLVEANLRLAVTFARRHWTPFGSSFALVDLIQEGNLGLMRAAETYDPSKGRFSTYAAWWINQRIGRAIRLQGSLVAVPARYSGRDRTLALGATGDGEGAATAVGVAPERVRDIQRACRYPLSLDTPLRNDDGEERSLHEVFADPRPMPDEAVGAWPIDRAQLLKVIESLDEREAAVLRLRFGLDDGVELTLRETGDRLGVTHEYIRVIEAKALARLQKRLSRLAWASGEPSPPTNGHAPASEDSALITAVARVAGSKRALAQRLGVTLGTLLQMGAGRSIPECHRVELRRIVEAGAASRAAVAGAANGAKALARLTGNGHTNGYGVAEVPAPLAASGPTDGHVFPRRGGGSVRLPPAIDPVAPVRLMDATGRVLETLTPEAFQVRVGSHRCPAHNRVGCRKCAERPTSASCLDCGASVGVSGICRSCRPIAHLGGAARRRKAEERKRLAPELPEEGRRGCRENFLTVRITVPATAGRETESRF